MKFMLMLFGDEAPFSAEVWTDEMNAAELAKHAAFDAWCQDHGVSVTEGAELQGSAHAQVVRADGGVQTGPFLEIREQLGGYYIIECASGDLALDAARRCPNYGAIEVRPLVEGGGEAAIG